MAAELLPSAGVYQTRPEKSTKWRVKAPQKLPGAGAPGSFCNKDQLNAYQWSTPPPRFSGLPGLWGRRDENVAPRLNPGATTMSRE